MAQRKVRDRGFGDPVVVVVPLWGQECENERSDASCPRTWISSQRDCGLRGAGEQTVGLGRCRQTSRGGDGDGRWAMEQQERPSCQVVAVAEADRLRT
jgi:hypothetical protein